MENKNPGPMNKRSILQLTPPSVVLPYFLLSKNIRAVIADVSSYMAGEKNQWEFSCDFEVDFESQEYASIVYATLAVDKELQPDKVKRVMIVSDGKLSVHFEATEARFLRASFSAFMEVLTLATKTIQLFGAGLELAEQTQLSRSLEKERQRAAENRQEYLAAKETADTQEGRAYQLEEEDRTFDRKWTKKKLLGWNWRRLLVHIRLFVSEEAPITKQSWSFEHGNLTQLLSSASSLGSIDESFFLQASLDSSANIFERRWTSLLVVTRQY
ncbi:hypothetical protein ACFE04_002232 [Oxalis oulophora]